EAGATILTGLTNDVEIPTYSGTSVEWEEELADAKDGAGEFGNFKFKPKRISGYVDISKQLLAQDSIGVERLIRETLAGAIALKLESTIFGNHETKATMPDGFFTTLPTAGGAMSWDSLVQMETDIDTQNALLGNLKYIMHPALVGKAKTTVKKERGAVGFIYDGGLINGYQVLATNSIAKGLQEGADEFGAIFGNWADFFIGQWGAVDLTIDPYTVARQGKVRIVINAYFDAGIIREDSFSVTTFK
ncbi:MAG: phage major capsid protein, partial [Eubacteriales bacterium]|nr:phage major capsid protein [Eubacteriales bacterium]